MVNISKLPPARPRFGTVMAFDIRNAREQKVKVNPQQLVNVDGIGPDQTIEAVNLLRILLTHVQKAQKASLPGGSADRVVFHAEPLEDDKVRLTVDLIHNNLPKPGTGMVWNRDCSTPKAMQTLAMQLTAWYQALQKEATDYFSS